MNYRVSAVVWIALLAGGLGLGCFAASWSSLDESLRYVLLTLGSVLSATSLASLVKIGLQRLDSKTFRECSPEEWAERAMTALASREEILGVHRYKKKYLYYCSWEGKKRIWRYVKIDFSSDFRHGYLCQKYSIARPSSEGSEPEVFWYEMKGYIFRKDLIILDFGLTSDEVNITHLPEYIGLDKIAFGIHSHMDWDSRWVSDPALISQKQIHDGTHSDYGILGSKDAQKLDALWRANKKYRSAVYTALQKKKTSPCKSIED